MELWNIKDLKPPAVSSCKATTKEIDIRLLDIALKDGVAFFENQQHLSTEAALLSRTSYRLKMKFRNSKDFKSVEKLCRVLRIYLQIQISRILKSLSNRIPKNYQINKTYTFSKNMIDYVLVRIQGLGKTLCRILETCKVVSTLMQQRLRLGHFWKIAILVFASTSRIFVIAKSLLKYVCELYTNLLPFSTSLNNSTVRWLPEEYFFPNRLDEWLNIDWLNLETNVIEIKDDDDKALSYFRLTDSDDDVEFCDEYILVKDESMIYEGDEDVEIYAHAEKVDELKNEISDAEEILDVSDTVDESVICLDDEMSEGNQKNVGKNSIRNHNEIDIGEAINISDVRSDSVIDYTKLYKKRKRRKRKASNVINDLNVSSNKKKKMGFNKINVIVTEQRKPLTKNDQSTTIKSGFTLKDVSIQNSPNLQKLKKREKRHSRRSAMTISPTVLPKNNQTMGKKKRRKKRVKNGLIKEEL